MSEKFDYQAKLGSLFDAFEGIYLPIEDFDLPVRIYNSLKKGGIHDLQQLLAMSSDELISVLWGNENRRHEVCEYIIHKLNLFNINGIPEWGETSEEAILMKGLNQQLSERYKNILGETAITAPFGEDGLSMPLLIKFSDETAVEVADLRIMFFGQETCEWTDTGAVDDVIEKYCSEFNDFSNTHRLGVFWRIISEMRDKINERLPGKYVSYIWNNIVKADYSPRADSKGYKVPDEVYAKFRDVNRALILSEIEIIKPDVLVFFTGSERSGFDKKIDDVFYYGTDVSTEKDPITIEGNKNILAAAHLPEIAGRKYEAYISYHPRGLEQNPKAKDFVLDAIAEQCVKAIKDRRYE